MLSDPDVEIRPQSLEEQEWKTRVIVVCTVTAATEIFFALFIIVYWKELRWSFRKITCPCVSTFTVACSTVGGDTCACNPLHRGNPPIMTRGIAGSQVTLCGE